MLFGYRVTNKRVLFFGYRGRKKNRREKTYSNVYNVNMKENKVLLKLVKNYIYLNNLIKYKNKILK